MTPWLQSLVPLAFVATLIAPPSATTSEPDDTPPSVPQRPRVTATTQATINLSWQPSHDFESGIAYYRVERDGQVVGQAETESLTDTGLLPQTTHTYRVQAVNGVGLASGWSAPKDATTQAPPPSPFGSLAQRGVWSWFGDPRAVQVGNFTYTGWIDWNGDVVVAKYDNRSGSVQTNVVRSALEVDDHDNPSVIFRPDGRLLVFYSKHAGSPMYYRLSSAPGDITAWDADQTVPGTIAVTYPNPFFLPDEGDALYLFWRNENGKPAFAISPDGGGTWGTARTLIDTGPNIPSYVKYASNGRDRIDIAFTDTHPEKSAVNNVYHITYRDGAFYRADGTLAKTVAQLPLTPADADLVYDAAAVGATGWVWDIALDSQERPVIAYANFPSTSDHRYRYARWTGASWLDTEITAGGGSIDESGDDPFYSGGAALDPNNPAVVYLSKQVGAAFELERWTTANGGASWSAQIITTGSSAKNVRPFVPRDHQPGSIGLLWLYGGYTSYTQYETRPLYRMDPPARRPRRQEWSPVDDGLGVR
ncbi:MAG: BNR-4 repeat-containing protein [Candidatus Kerfeldbacteria bacterium]|nr:BNR-4 repeat-containing protein [Candidatus Kerfeldbacteria bacterium]